MRVDQEMRRRALAYAREQQNWIHVSQKQIEARLEQHRRDRQLGVQNTLDIQETENVLGAYQAMAEKLAVVVAVVDDSIRLARRKR